MYVGTRRNGVGAFLVQLFGYKKSLQGWKSTPCRLFRAEREGFEPPEPLSSTVFKTAAIDHSATSPRDKSITSFLIYQTKNENIFKFFATTPFIMLKLSNIRMQQNFTFFEAFNLSSTKISPFSPLAPCLKMVHGMAQKALIAHLAEAQRLI